MTAKDVGKLQWAILPLALGLAACGSSQPIVLEPKLPGVARAACPALRRTFVVTVRDKRGYANPRNVGFTQTGLFNVRTSLETQRPAANLVHGALEKALADCGLLQRSGSPADARIEVELVTMQLTEKTGFTSETIEGLVRYDVEVWGESPRARLRRFAALGRAEASGVDTTADSEPVLARALSTSVEGFLKDLVGSAPAPVAASIEPSSAIAPTAHVFTRDEEEARFGKPLSDERMLSLELGLQREGTGWHPIKLRRHRIRLLFSDGIERVPLDPLKVRERHTISGSVYNLGLVGALLFSSMNSVEGPGVEGAADELLMPTARNELKGLLFFDLEGVGVAKPTQLSVEYEDATTGLLQQQVVGLK